MEARGCLAYMMLSDPMPEIMLRVQCQGIVNIFLAPEKPR